MDTQLPTGTVTFLFTDIEGSTPLWEQIPNEMQISLAQHHAILHEAIRANGGQVFQNIGDASRRPSATRWMDCGRRRPHNAHFRQPHGA
jgi:class 3 adenylate cyclase